MLIRQRISGCDFTGETYKPPIEGYGAVSRGATGRWCVVMWMGPEYYKKYHEGQVKTYEEAVEFVETEGQPGDFVDF